LPLIVYQNLRISPTCAENSFMHLRRLQLFQTKWLSSKFCNNCHYNAQYWFSKCNLLITCVPEHTLWCNHLSHYIFHIVSLRAIFKIKFLSVNEKGTTIIA